MGERGMGRAENAERSSSIYRTCGNYTVPRVGKNECCEIYRYYFNCIVLFTQRAQIAQNLRAGGVTEWYLKTLERLFILLISYICSDNSCDACYRNRYLCRQIGATIEILIGLCVAKESCSF